MMMEWTPPDWAHELPIYTIIYGDDAGEVISYVEHYVGVKLTPKEVFERWVKFRAQNYENPPIWGVMLEEDTEIHRWADESKCCLIDWV